MGIASSSPKQRAVESTNCGSIPNLPEEVIEQILSRLPVKSLLKFTCVSKSWNYTIFYSQQFSKIQLLNSRQENCRIVLGDGGGKFKHCSLYSLFNESAVNSYDIGNFSVSYSKELDCVGSCNGLVCLSMDKKDLILWNPSINKWKKLPDSGISSTTYSNYGFGFDKSSDDYKVVGFSYNMRVKHNSGFEVKVYSLKTNTWKRIKNHMSCWRTTYPAPFLNVKIHWTARTNLDIESEENNRGYKIPETKEYIWTPRWYIAYLDLETEEYGIIHKPDFVEGGYIWDFVVSEGGLYVFCLHTCRTDVWKIEGYDMGNDNWTKVVSMPNYDDFLKSHYKTPLRVLNNCEILFLCGSKLVIFDMKDYSYRYPEMKNFSGVKVAGTYMESLISPLV